ncbi:TetR family transcriptional regulator [Gordonia sp. PDNC005]|uniref:TetR/AcrR family transcriptional regulator n=1 Tax=unclassified Gordonia (in: high G+C Gram-positive bacteria) TaxID=2657482 RepID=UPI0019629D2C|nr:TetR family transcriptional regulator [Gordonia sp. PDNC005]QRY62370.1 TetR family transcriptional regulator [Gordonia sp. PDNC005]
MPSDSRSESTRDRIIGAATVEFADHGIGAARIDRIAKAAKTSKERVYAYFRSKEELYRFVSARELDAVAEATRLDPADLPAYAGRLHDYFVEHPHSRRLMRWGELELSSTDDTARETARRKTVVLREAQHNGLIDPTWDPLDVLVFVNRLASAWVDQPGLPSIDTDAGAAFSAARRQAIVDAVERLFPVGGPPAQTTDSDASSASS